ncbi:ST6GALNAC1 [Branchiostoma lanceolatum]|uniref:alpha-N-acetylgalactosaminide alpha-2,6-sialyltransferase n=1 Tax=Branchiostoma lanceolatum TaxID=7740 RepID=A0A8J9ZQE6_BRALA|nr:ST6GALNAC1 [Branchiostoma lanceolatum]
MSRKNLPWCSLQALFLQLLGLACFMFLLQVYGDWFRVVLTKATELGRETSGLLLYARSKKLTDISAKHNIEAVSVPNYLDNLDREKQQFLDRISETEEERFGNISVKLPGNILKNLVPPHLQKTQLEDMPYTRDQHHMKSVCPVSLRWKVNSSAWFQNRFVEDIKLFLDSEDLEDSYWTSHLTAYFTLPFGYKRSDRKATERLLGMLDNPDVFGFHGDKQRKPCVRCAVVGTGGVLNGSGKGEEIDAHDYVFRLNHALMQEPFTMDVGKKLSFYISYPESHHTNEMIGSSHALHIYIPFKTTDLAFITRWLHNRTLPGCGPMCKRKLNNNLNRTTMKITHPDFIRYVFANYMNTSLSWRPTTGAMTVFLAIQLCDVVNLYGFGYDPRFPMHYYDHRKIPEQRADGEVKEGAHDYSEERRLWERLHEEKIVYWYNRQD